MMKYLLLTIVVLSSCTVTNNSSEHTMSSNEHAGHSLPALIQSKDYSVKLDFDKLERGKSAVVNITVLNAQTRAPITDLEIDHEKRLHVFFVSSDLEQFLHLHAEDDSNDSGTFEVEPTFQSGGNWLVVAEWKHKGQLYYETQEISIEGAKAEPITKDYSLQKTNDGYSAELLSNHVRASTTPLEFSLQFNNQSIADSLQNYLGAPMHVAIWSEDQKFFTHTHAQVDGKNVVAQANLPKPGNYKIWIQFKHSDAVHTFDYWVTVKER